MVKGTFKDISFVEFLQLMQVAHKTGRLEVTYENKWAMVIFNEGVIWHVEPRGFQGASSEEILYMLVGMTSANFTFQRIIVLPALDRTVEITTNALIKEGTQRVDDDKKAEAIIAEGGVVTADPLKQILVFKPGAEAKVRFVPPAHKRIAQLIDGLRTVEEVIELSQLDPAQADTIIKDLVMKEAVELVTPVAAPVEEK